MASNRPPNRPSNSAGTDNAPPPAEISSEIARNRAIAAIVLPLLAAIVIGVGSGSPFAPSTAIGSAAPVFAALGITGWFVGLRLYGLRGMGLRGGRPLFAGIGFAVLAWVAVLIGRFLPMRPQASVDETGQGIIEIPLHVLVMVYQTVGAGRAYFYLLVFEAFAVQLWTFGIVFRALADWRGGLTAAITSGILFGAVGYVFFRESFVPGLPALIYFLSWGILYGIIRLRTGSILGPVIVQSLQSFTAWFVLEPPADMTQTGIRTVYLAISVLFAVIIWRLWPRLESDYRV